ncbi:hypothetical protein L1077_22115 [Pseudoalteromonas luteoviolacea]|uniref:DUF7660 family protein n=1 Tax=Pseudoalteromonas luteoviolacea TaxID=43657 RepID=UPI001F189661|nr:hypothetical protein [Pseudoalteromonas luteoviolacea]MCF6442126.1 hypothetical protein [Pseudoalteromonas luteoviolacea]
MNKPSVNSKSELLSLIKSLSLENPESWENKTASDFVEALGAWLNDADGYYKNFNLAVDADTPSWQLFADAIQAARHYE